MEVIEHTVHYVELRTADNGDLYRWEYCDDRADGGKGIIAVGNMGPMAQLVKPLARKS